MTCLSHSAAPSTWNKDFYELFPLQRLKHDADREEVNAFELFLLPVFSQDGNLSSFLYSLTQTSRSSAKPKYNWIRVVIFFLGGVMTLMRKYLGKCWKLSQKRKFDYWSNQHHQGYDFLESPMKLKLEEVAPLGSWLRIYMINDISITPTIMST